MKKGILRTVVIVVSAIIIYVIDFTVANVQIQKLLDFAITLSVSYFFSVQLISQKVSLTQNTEVPNQLANNNSGNTGTITINQYVKVFGANNTTNTSQRKDKL